MNDIKVPDGSSFFDPARKRSLGSQHLRSAWARAFRAIVWRRLPRSFRTWVLKTFVAPVNGPIAIGAPAREPVCVAGLLSSATGIGEGGRLAGRALTALGYDVRSVDVSELLLGSDVPRDDAPLLERGGGTVLLHFNPDHLPALLTLLGRKRLKGKRIIGYWAWELAAIPEHWIPALDEVDEIWAPSRFVADAVQARTSKPVRVVPHPVAQDRTGFRRRDSSRPEDTFIVLTMFSFASSFARKNPMAAVEAFRAAFGNAANKQLIIKVSDAHESPDEMEQLIAAIGDAPNIRLEQRRLSDQERLDLIASADAFLSLHRSEGFGLVLAEAMLAGVPVVATDWSGNVDFMDDESAFLVPFRMVPAVDGRGTYGTGGTWAEPDIAVAAAHLASLAAAPDIRRSVSAKGKARVRQSLGLDTYRRTMDAALGVPRSLRVSRFAPRALVQPRVRELPLP